MFLHVPLLIAGSIATDHLMGFGGKFADSLVVEQLDKISVSFLVDDLEIRRGGVAANIVFGLGCLGLEPVLVGAAGDDFADYRSWLERHGVDCQSVHISESKHTARFVCTTDPTGAQFLAGATGASVTPLDGLVAEVRALRSDLLSTVRFLARTANPGAGEEIAPIMRQIEQNTRSRGATSSSGAMATIRSNQAGYAR